MSARARGLHNEVTKTTTKREEQERGETKEEEKGKRRDQKECSGGSGVALGRPKGAPRGYGGHLRGTRGSKSPPPLPTSLRLGDSEDLRAKKRSYSGSDTPQGRRIYLFVIVRFARTIIIY